MAEAVFLFGNGLSIGVSPDFAVPEMTRRVNARLDASLRTHLDELARLSRPDMVVPPEAVPSFEQIAGPLDRVSNALRSIAPLARNAGEAHSLTTAHAYLRARYLQLVGLVLDDIARSAHTGDAAKWASLNEMAIQLRALHARHGCAIFTLSYDTILDSALIESRAGWFYDGFPKLRLDRPLDRWPGTLPLYHLHGSLLWYESSEGIVRKVRSDDPLHSELLARWGQGDDALGLPIVVLTDAKVPAAAENPFDLFYQEIWGELQSARVFVVAGYSFGDEPVNAVIRRWLSRPSPENRRLEVWTHVPARAQERFEQRIADLAEAGAAVVFHQVALPDSTVVARVMELLG